LKNNIYRDVSLRSHFVHLEPTLIILNSLAFNKILPLSLRIKIFLLIDLISFSKSKIRNYCHLTGRSRGILPEFKFSRIKFRELADKGLIPGIRRSSW
jgi:ribosomal protein S14